MVDNQDNKERQSMPGGSERIPLIAWLREELIDHLFPWGPNFYKQKSLLVAAGIGFAVTATVVWILYGLGHIGSVAVIAWWTGWSVYEFLCRRRCKPWVKEGSWFGRHRRKADSADLIFYVATKNLLIGVALFLILFLLGYY